MLDDHSRLACHPTRGHDHDYRRVGPSCGIRCGDERGFVRGRRALLILSRVRQATSGTRTAHMATNPKAIPVAVMYARIVCSPTRLGQNGDCASMTL